MIKFSHIFNQVGSKLAALNLLNTCLHIATGRGPISKVQRIKLNLSLIGDDKSPRRWAHALSYVPKADAHRLTITASRDSKLRPVGSSQVNNLSELRPVGC